MKKLLLILFITLFSISCTKGSSDNSGLASNENSTRDLTTNCGVVFEGKLELPIEASRGFIGSVVATGPNQAIFTSGNTQILIKLQGVRASGNATLNANATRIITESVGQNGVFFPADGECSQDVGGGSLAVVGSLFTRGGESVNEALLEEGLALVDATNVCGANLITTCYQALSDQGGSGLVVSNFLWKPVAERDGNLVVLLNQRNATVVVNGTTLTDFGPSNGRGTTARANRPGSAFGSNITVQVFDQLGRVINFPGGADRFIIPNGGQRVEFQ